MKILQAVIGLAGGIGLFLYGMKRCSDSLQKMAAYKIKELVKVVTKNSLRGVLVGVLVTVALQSSSATCAIIVSLVSAQMMTLNQTMGMLLGSAIGSSLTAQLIAFKITYLALGLIFAGTVLILFAKKSRERNIGQILFGFGLIFYGMFVMSAAMAPLKDMPVVVKTIINLEQYPLLAFLVAILITSLIQSSAGFLALVMTLAGQGLIGAYSVIPFVLGAHIGGTITGVISSLGAPGQESKRAAFANFFFKGINGIVFLPFYRPLTEILKLSSPDIARQIANGHTMFSIIMAVGFLPLIPRISRLMTRLVPDKNDGSAEIRYLKSELLEIPELAIDQAYLQTAEMGRNVLDKMVSPLFATINNHHEEIMDKIIATEGTIDFQYKKINKYVTLIYSNDSSEELTTKCIRVLYAANYVERIGDIIINAVRIIYKINQNNLIFSDEGLKEIEMLYDRIVNNLSRSLKAFAENDVRLAGLVIKEHPKIIRKTSEIRFNHFQRMRAADNSNGADIGSYYLDFLEALLNIDNQSFNIGQAILGII